MTAVPFFSARLAEKADQETPILDTEEIEGIEEADAVLLEEDNYEAPEDSEIDIPAAIDDNGNAVEVVETEEAENPEEDVEIEEPALDKEPVAEEVNSEYDEVTAEEDSVEAVESEVEATADDEGDSEFVEEESEPEENVEETDAEESAEEEE